jgi:riboflavin kinase/FMN adenylyltransferase
MHTLSTDLNQLAMPAQLVGRESVLTIGAFDGIHIGHQDLVKRMVSRVKQIASSAPEAPAARKGSIARDASYAGLITFFPHPTVVLYPEKPFSYLTTPAEKKALLEPLGLDVLVVLEFEPSLAAMTPRAFVQTLRERMGMRELWVGPDFALGRKRQGDSATLRCLGGELGFEVYDVPYVTQSEIRVSSSTIRAQLRAGNVESARQLLGRHYTVSGKVVPGARRGRDLGFPTANLDVAPGRAIPAYGVYATYAYLGADCFHSVTNVGVRPSFDNGVCSVETFLLDFDQDIYGRELTVAFAARLRPEERFADIQELIVQMERDVEQARQIL